MKEEQGGTLVLILLKGRTIVQFIEEEEDGAFTKRIEDTEISRISHSREKEESRKIDPLLNAPYLEQRVAQNAP